MKTNRILKNNKQRLRDLFTRYVYKVFCFFYIYIYIHIIFYTIYIFCYCIGTYVYGCIRVSVLNKMRKISICAQQSRVEMAAADQIQTGVRAVRCGVRIEHTRPWCTLLPHEYFAGKWRLRHNNSRPVWRSNILSYYVFGREF